MKLCFALLLLTATPALAARAGSELSHSLTLGAGISSPAVDGAVRSTNPSGLIYNTGTKILGHIGSGSGSADFGGHLILGNGSVGAGAGYRRGGNDVSLVDYGVGVAIEGINSAFGFGGTSIIAGGATSSDLNAGYMYGPNSDITFGAALYGVRGGISAVGLGLSGDLGPNLTLGVDSVASREFGDLGFKPFLGVHLQEVQLGMAYGLGGRAGNDLSAGLSFRLGRTVQLTGYYNFFSEYYLGLMFRL